MASRRVSVGTWVCPDSNEKRDDALVALAKRGVVLLGESHDQAEHHRWQLHAIMALFSHRPDIVLGFEMFPRRILCVPNIRFIMDAENRRGKFAT
jgi:hypothetical protein